MELQDTIISAETFKLAEGKGFDFSNIEYRDSNTLKLVNNYLERLHYWGSEKEANLIRRPSQSLVQKWLREKYDIHIAVIRQNYFSVLEYKYYYYTVSKGKEYDIFNSEDLFGSLMEECEQDIKGLYLNNKKFKKLIFERKYAFNTYEEALENALQESLKTIKK